MRNYHKSNCGSTDIKISANVCGIYAALCFRDDNDEDSALFVQVALVDKAKHVKMFISSGLGLEANALKAASDKISLANGVAQQGMGSAVGQTIL